MEGVGSERGWGGGNLSTSVLSLYAAITKPQVGPCTNLSPLGKAACRYVSRLWLFNTRARGNTLSPLSDSVTLTNGANIDSGGTKKQVAQHVKQKRQLFMLPRVSYRILRYKNVCRHPVLMA